LPDITMRLHPPHLELSWGFLSPESSMAATPVTGGPAPHEERGSVVENIEPGAAAVHVAIRPVRESDAEGFLALCRRLDTETSFMLLEPGERTTTVGEMRQHLRSMVDGANRLLLIAEHARQPVGYLEAVGGTFRRNRHTAHLVVGILQEWSGRGLGTRLFAALEDWAAKEGIHRLQLNVMTHNERAVALYRKVGFVVEGTRRHSLRVGDDYVDEFHMAKLLPEREA
jgi:RimJ/RimL family protein N-acetyltransferase